MVKLNVEINLESDAKELFNLAIDFERTKDLFPAQLRNVRIISKNNDSDTIKCPILSSSIALYSPSSSPGSCGCCFLKRLYKLKSSSTIPIPLILEAQH